jgi:hypothetical protein
MLSGRVALTMTLVGSAGLLGLVTCSSRPLPADDHSVASPPKPSSGDCPSCWNEELIPITGDPEVDALAREAVLARAKTRLQALLEEQHRKHVEMMKIWQGTKVVVVPDGARPETDQATYETIAAVLSADPVAPSARSEIFANYLNDASEFKCVGWKAAIMAITPRDDGWEATIHIRPHLERERGGIVFTPHVSIETWRLSDRGDLQFVMAVEDGNIGIGVD